jgi:hypothetical protein
MMTIHDNDLKWLLGKEENQLVASIDEPDGWISRMGRIGFKPTVSLLCRITESVPKHLKQEKAIEPKSLHRSLYLDTVLHMTIAYPRTTGIPYITGAAPFRYLSTQLLLALATASSNATFCFGRSRSGAG